MNNNKPTAPLNILLAIDGSKYSAAAVRLADRIAWPSGTSVRVLAVAPERLPLGHVSQETQSMIDEALANIRQQEWAAAEMLATLAANKLHAGGLIVETKVCEGRPAEMILERATPQATDLIVIGAKGLSAPGEFLLGSTAHKLVHYAGCSVLVARPLGQTQHLRTLLAADGSLEAQRAAEFLCAHLPSHWVAVTVVGVAEAKVDFPSDLDQAGRSSTANSSVSFRASLPEAVRQVYLDVAETRAREITAYLQGCHRQTQSVVRFGHPAAEILSVAQEQDTDLIVVGACDQTRANPFLLGSVAQKVVKYAPCSVLVVR